MTEWLIFVLGVALVILSVETGNLRNRITQMEKDREREWRQHTNDLDAVRRQVSQLRSEHHRRFPDPRDVDPPY